jgi:hypothetical protein
MLEYIIHSGNQYLTSCSTLLLAGPSAHVFWGIGLDRLDAETMGLNPAWGMDVCPRLFIIIIIHVFIINTI